MFGGQPQANGVDHVWIILYVIRDWVRGSLELHRGSLMTWLLLSYRRGLLTQPLQAIFFSMTKEAGLGQP